MEPMTLTDPQRLRIAELAEDGRAATTSAKRRLAGRRGDHAARLVRAYQMPEQTRIDTQVGKPTRTQPQTISTRHLRRLEGTTQAVLATLRRSLIEKVQPTRDGLAHEATIAFDLNDDQRALAIIDDVAQTVGISGLL